MTSISPTNGGMEVEQSTTRRLRERLTVAIDFNSEKISSWI